MAPRIDVTTQLVTVAGLAPSMTGPTVDGDIVDAGNGTWLTVSNGSGSSINVTIQNPQTVEGLAVANRVIAVAAGATKDIPITPMFKQPTDAAVGPGRALVDYSAVTTVTRAVKRQSV
jgi:hypothetical protein